MAAAARITAPSAFTSGVIPSFSLENSTIGKVVPAGPDTKLASFEFEDFTAVWEHRLFAANEAEKHNVGCYFYGTNGTFHQAWQKGWTFYPANDRQQVQHQDPQLHAPDNQNIKELFADFLGAIKEKRRPLCDIEVAHRSTNMSLLGMLSARLGRSLQWDGDKELVIGDDQANKLLSREYRKPWEYPT